MAPTENYVARLFNMGQWSGEDPHLRLDRDGSVVLEATSPSPPDAITAALASAQACTRVVFGVRLARGLNAALVDQVIAMSDGIAGLSGAMRGLVSARDAVLGAIAAIDADIKKLVHASDACRQLMTIPGVGPLSALAFTAAIDDPDRFRRSRDLGTDLGLVLLRYRSGEVDYVGGISKLGDRPVRTLLSKRQTSC